MVIPGYFGPSIVPSLLKQKLGIPALFSIYCPASLLPRKMPPVDRYSIRALSLGLDRIIAVTENVKASLTNYSVDPSNIIVLPSCFDEKVYSQFTHQGSSATTQTMNFKAPKVLFVGNVEKTKGLDIFIDAAKLVLSEKSTTKFIITLHEPEECLQRAWLLAHQKLGNSIEVLGVVKNMASLISEVDVVVVPLEALRVCPTFL